MNSNHILAMAQMQDTLNRRINPDWAKAGYAWHRAIMVEAVEALEHYGWKWWKGETEPNKVQIQLELVDIWHFALSLVMTRNEGVVALTAQMLVDYLTTLEKDPDAFGDVTGVSTADVLTMLAGSAGLQQQFNGPAFCEAMRRFELSWDQLYTMYIAKNVLNTFRQAHGYKAGTYVKQWGDAEDNVFLEQLMADYPEASPELLTSMLEVRYAEVAAA